MIIFVSNHPLITEKQYEDKPKNWTRKNAAWAKNLLTELNASYELGTTDMRFYVFEHKE